MGILTRYIVLEILKVLFPVWVALAFLIFLLDYLAKVFAIQADAGVILFLYLLKFPSFLQLVFPAAALFASLAVLGTMNKAREVVAVQSMGIRVRGVLLPCVGALLLASIPYVWITDTVSPWAMRKHYEMYDMKVLRKPSRFSEVRREKIWYKNNDVLYNVGNFDYEKSVLYDVTIYTFDEDFHIAQTLYAEKATWKKVGWELSNGIVAVADKRLEVPVSQAYTTRMTTLIEEPKVLVRNEVDPDSLSQSALRRTISRYKSLGINAARLEVVYQSRYAFFLVSFIFLFLAFPRAMRFNRGGGTAKDILFVGGVCMTYWLVFNIFMNLGSTSKLNPVFAAWAPSVMFLVGVYFYYKSRTLQSESQ